MSIFYVKSVNIDGKNTGYGKKTPKKFADIKKSSTFALA